MALLTTGLIDNPAVAGIWPSESIDVLLTNDTILPANVQISGFYVSGGVKTPYVLELFTLVPGQVATRNYFSQFDIYEFQFDVTLTTAEISVWGKDAVGNLNAEHRLVAEEMSLVI